MKSKTYFNIAGFFLVAFIITSFGKLIDLPIWIHRVFTVLFALFVILAYVEKKKEEESDTEE